MQSTVRCLFTRRTVRPGRLRGHAEGQRAGSHRRFSALVILAGYGRTIETALVWASPAWLTELTTRY
jgi:hypothetical protein